MKVTPEQVVRVAKEHVKLYENRVRLGHEGARHINTAECERLLGIWQAIVGKGGHGLTAEEAQEVIDVYDSGEFDKIFKEKN